MLVNALPKLTDWRDYVEMCKPKVVALMLLTMVVGMFLAVPGFIAPALFVNALIGVGLCAGSAAAINHLLDRHIDAVMARTKKRPIAQGRVSVKQALAFAIAMGLMGLIVLSLWVNVLTASLTFLTLIGYALIYTGYLKRATSQNIVIGGLAGAAPPLLGWTAVTNQLSGEPLLLVLIIFIWTPPHFWALAIYRYNDYKEAAIPMLPVTHGIPFTRLSILLYSCLLFSATLLPYAVGMSGLLYLVASTLLSGRFLQWAVRLYRDKQARTAMLTFRFSIVYLMLLFIVLLVDHYL